MGVGFLQSVKTLTEGQCELLFPDKQFSQPAKKTLSGRQNTTRGYVTPTVSPSEFETSTNDSHHPTKQPPHPPSSQSE
jgi:hypothetical protein